MVSISLVVQLHRLLSYTMLIHFKLFASIRLATVQSVTHMSDLQLWSASVKNAISDPQAASASFAVDRVYR